MVTFSNVHALLCTAQIFSGVHAHHIFSMDDLFFLKTLSWTHVTFQQLRRFGLATLHTYAEAWLSTIKEQKWMVALFPLTSQVSLSGVCYTIMENMPENLPQPVELARPTLSSPPPFPREVSVDFYIHIYTPSPREQPLKDEE